MIRVVLALVLLAGCGGPLYLARLGMEEARLLWRRQPIAELLEQPALAPELRERLELVLAARTFAKDRLGLDVGESYTTFAEVDGRATVWVLSAARHDRLEAHTWWYPIVGRVPYRGFFERDEARSAGRALERQGLDVDVRPAIAYSTLGWLADPLLSTMTDDEPVGLVETVLHELFHATLYVPGAASFNESAATFAGHRGAMAFFCAGPGTNPERCRRARDDWRMTRERGRILGRLADRLRDLYAEAPPAAVCERRRAQLSAAAGRALARRGVGQADELTPPNNARLLGNLIYTTHLGAFEALAPGNADPGPALRWLATAARGRSDPFEVVLAGALQSGGVPL